MSKRRGHALDGLHLLPSSVAWLPGQLRTAAACACGNVAVEHTDLKVLTVFVVLTPVAAMTLATNIEAAA